MTYASIQEHAAVRRQEWLAKHGQHEWEKHDLLLETLEELADAWNYLDALEKQGWGWVSSPRLGIRQAWEVINHYRSRSSH